ncbi:maleylacetoacetate isomerase [Sphingomonas sp.]|uniref:maleylacetoacetate isomerase n=1 Tax=Sphingomonas sp. TaxID=28214 RepID=UPI00286B86A1|nr:maleylacetoacetate isomerase [Sphingomonas sp.]
MTTPILHDFWRSSASYRVRIGLNLKGVAYTSHAVSLPAGEQKSPDYRALNPQGFVPMLEIDGHRLTQSLAILDYLDATHKEPPFVAHDPAERSHILAMALVVACDIHPLNNLRVLKYLGGPLGQPEAVRDDWYRHWVVEGLAALEAMAARSAGQWLNGDGVSLADICLIPQMYNARRFDVALDAYPTLVRVDAAAQNHSAFAAAHPDNQEQPA